MHGPKGDLVDPGEVQRSFWGNPFNYILTGIRVTNLMREAVIHEK